MRVSSPVSVAARERAPDVAQVDVVKRGAGDRDRGHGDPSARAPPARRARPGAVIDPRAHDRPSMTTSRTPASRASAPSTSTVGAAAELDVDGVAAQLGLELLGAPVDDHAAPIDDRERAASWSASSR